MRNLKHLLNFAFWALLFGLLIFFASTSKAQSEYQVLKYLSDLGYTNSVPKYGIDYKYLQTANGVIIDLWRIAEVPKPDYTNLPSVAASLTWYQEIKLQDSKPYLLKLIDNMYVTFLTNDWTKCLQANSIIASNQTITVTNTTSSQNILYLISLKNVSKTDYYNMAGEFDRYRNQIEREWETLGWMKDDAMILVRWHELVGE